MLEKCSSDRRPSPELLEAYKDALAEAWPTLQKAISVTLETDPIVEVDVRRCRVLAYPGDQVPGFIATMPAKKRKAIRKAHLEARKAGQLLLFLRDDDEQVLLARTVHVCQECANREGCPEREFRQAACLC